MTNIVMRALQPHAGELSLPRWATRVFVLLSVAAHDETQSAHLSAADICSEKVMCKVDLLFYVQFVGFIRQKKTTWHQL